jgi:transcriptional regulator with XRE-family HTH domain
MQIVLSPEVPSLKCKIMERIKRARMIFCKYLSSIAKEKNLTTEDIVRKTNKSYTEVKRIMEGLFSPSFDDLLLIADLLNTHVTLTTEIPLGHKKISNTIPLLFEKTSSVLPD